MTEAYIEIRTALDVLASVEQKNVSALDIITKLEKLHMCGWVGLTEISLGYKPYAPLDRRTYVTSPIVEQTSANQRIYTTEAHRIEKVKSFDPLLGVRGSLD